MIRAQKVPPKLRGFQSATSLEEMLQVKTFEQLLQDGDIYNVQGAANKSGYDPKHIHRLCREDRIPHVRRGVVAEEVQFYFLAWQLKELFEYRQAKARA